MTSLTNDVLNRYEWDNKEVEILTTKGYESIREKFYNMDDNTYNKVTDYFTAWLMGEIKKSKLNYWMKKAHVSVEELNIWMTV